MLQIHQPDTTSRLEGFGLTSDREIVRRVAIAMLLFGVGLELMYSVVFNPPDWTDAAAVLLSAAGLLWVVLPSWDKEEIDWRMVVPPALLGTLAVGLIGIGDEVEVGLSFLFLPAAVVMVFFWDSRAVQFAVMVPLSIIYIAVPAIWGDSDALEEAAMTLPLLIFSSWMLGWLFNRFRISRVEEARFRGTITALLMALEARDNFTAEHASAVLRLVTSVCEDLGLDEKQTQHIADVALLHDVGKIGVPDEILEKPAALNSEEWELVRRHPEIGQRILAEVPGFENVASAVRHEHERWDGSGYPDGLAGEQIPLASRIVLACDAYHVMLTERPWSDARSELAARQELRACSGTQFDPRVVAAILDALPPIDEAVR